MAINLQLKRETYAIPGVMVVDQECNPPATCCPPDIEVGTYDCEDPDIGTLPGNIVATISGLTGSQSNLFTVWSPYSSITNDCTGNPWTVGRLNKLFAWGNGSVSGQYVGLFSGSSLNLASCGDTFDGTCDYHAYAMSLDPLTNGDNNGSPLYPQPLVGVGSESPPCCCHAGPNLYWSAADEEYSFTPAADAQVCAARVAAFSVPCNFDEVDQCFGTIWYTKELIDACIGVVCAGGVIIPNGDVVGGLYCSDPVSGNIGQYPFRMTLEVYRNAFLFIAQGEDCCDNPPFIYLKSYLVRRRWLNDGSADIQNEPAIWAWDDVVLLTFDANGTISASGSADIYECDSECEIGNVTVDIDAES